MLNQISKPITRLNLLSAKTSILPVLNQIRHVTALDNHDKTWLSNHLLPMHQNLTFLQDKISSNSANLHRKIDIKERLIHDKERKYKLVIFDKDGTLICFHSFWTPWAQTLANNINDKVKADITQQTFGVLGVCSKTMKIGPGLLAEATNTQIINALAHMVKKVTSLDFDSSINLVKDSMPKHDGELITKNTKQIDNLNVLFSILAEHGIKTAICTSDSRDSTIEHLKKLNIMHLISSIYCGNDANARPKPEPYNAKAICKENNVDELETIMIGDTRTDIEFAQNADLGGSIGVLSGISDEELLSQVGATHIVNSVKDILPIVIPNKPISLSENVKKLTIKDWSLLVVDKDGTLIDLHDKWKNWALQMGKKLEKLIGAKSTQTFYEIIGFCSVTHTMKSSSIIVEGSFVYLKQCIENLLLLGALDSDQTDKFMKENWIESSEIPDFPIEAAIDSLWRIKEKSEGKIKIALNTSDSRMSTCNFLNRFKLNTLFDAVVTADDVGNYPKPLPNSLKMIQDTLRLPYDETDKIMVIGDSRTDMTYGLSAKVGLKIGVLSGIGTPDTLLPHADILLPNLSYLPHLIWPN